jgi:hypothetical protein
MYVPNSVPRERSGGKMRKKEVCMSKEENRGRTPFMLMGTKKEFAKALADLSECAKKSEDFREKLFDFLGEHGLYRCDICGKFYEKKDIEELKGSYTSNMQKVITTFTYICHFCEQKEVNYDPFKRKEE